MSDFAIYRNAHTSCHALALLLRLLCSIVIAGFHRFDGDATFIQFRTVAQVPENDAK